MAGQANMSAAELLENFISDLIDGFETNGSNERDAAKRWFQLESKLYPAHLESMKVLLSNAPCIVLLFYRNRVAPLALHQFPLNGTIILLQ